MELIDNQGKGFGDGEGSFSFQSKLWVDYRPFEVSGFEPNFVFKFEREEGVLGMGGHDLTG